MKKLALLLLIVAPALLADEDPFADSFFPPELIMQNQQSLGLTNEQKSLLRAEVLKAQTRFTDLQWQLQDEMQRLTVLAKEPSPSEEKILGQLDKVLGLEREIKRTHITLVVRLKRALSPDQQRQLAGLANRRN
jgi:Spy/CpxP family protein refolding chaperone